MACGVKYADERSEHDFCYKCHFDLTDELLDQPSGSKDENPMNEIYKFWKGKRVRLVNPNEEVLSNSGPMQQIEYPVNGQLETGYAFVKDLSDLPVEASPIDAPLNSALIIQGQARRILTHPSTRYAMNAAGYLERMELKLGGAIHILSPYVGLMSEIGEMLYSFFNEVARQIEAEKSDR